MFGSRYWHSGYFSASYWGKAAAGVGVPSPMYTLELWQAITFKHLADLWEPVEVQNASGDTEGQQWVQRWQGVPNYMVAQPNVPVLIGIGQVAEHTIFTYDVRWWDDKQPIDSNWVIVDRSVNPDGTLTRNYGLAWVVQETHRKTANSIFDEGHRETVSEALPPLPYGNIPKVF